MNNGIPNTEIPWDNAEMCWGNAEMCCGNSAIGSY